MRNRIERLRVWLLAAAGLLVVVLAVFIGSARYLKRHFLARLPARLGMDIKSETNGFTYSQSVQGRTIFTVHAAKEIEHADGKITLHDVSMVLYGRTGDRADRIEGNEFEYDQGAGVLRAVGLVHMDLGASGAAVRAPGANLNAAAVEDAPKLLHATTNGLVYLQRLGIAATSDAIDFEAGQMKGHAIGADYNTDTGQLLLHSAVRMEGVVRGRPAELTATAAQLSDRGQRVLLVRAHYVSDEQTMDAGKALIYTRADNTLERIEAAEGVTLGSQGATVTAARGNVLLGAKNEPETAMLEENVWLVENGALREARGQASAAKVRFDDGGALVDAVFSGGVEMTERTRASESAREPWSVRALKGSTVHLEMVSVAKGRSALKTAEATGGAQMRVVENGSAAGAQGRGTTELSGDELMADLTPPVEAGQASRLESVTGRGHTEVRQVSAEGVEQTSSGDSLEARFRPASAGKAGVKASGTVGSSGVELATAVQQGHVVVTRRVLASQARPKQGSAGYVQRATAERAVYDGTSDAVELTGAVEMAQSESELWADRVVFRRATGDAEAQGAVKVSYEASGGANGGSSGEPVHVLADRAEMVRATEVATFFGRPARMWQGGSQVQAPVLELAREQRELRARGGAGGGQVEAILMGTEQATAGARAGSAGTSARVVGGAKGQAKTPQVIRVVSRELVYSDEEREARLGGGVVMKSGEETIRSRSATAYLASGDEGGKAEVVSLDGRLERVIASGDVVVEQPGRRATGEMLSYTAGDGMVVLTGTAKTPPLLVDAAQGTHMTAAAFRFAAEGDTVEALSAVPNGVFERQARTVTPVRH